MTKQEIEKMKRAAISATKGDWIIDQRDDFIGIESTSDSNEWVCYEEGKIDEQDLSDFKFIATANPTAILSLIEQIEKAHKVIEFYGDKNNWRDSEVFDPNESDYGRQLFGGKAAREFLKEFEK